MEKHFKQYLILRDRIETLSMQLEQKHKKHISCKAGCDLCCMDYSVFPIEFYFIREQLKTINSKLRINEAALEEDCIFLIDHKCTVYNERPIICRTHGLPLLFMGNNDNWELSACELNFTEFDMEEFSEENTFPQDQFNSKLFMLNKAFIKELKDFDYSEFDLIPIKKLKEYM